jgi:2-polyprenyl-6-hydroxyphenyl methylase/3-demethylubiquinone-9 3-methyltransferase
MLDAEGIMIAIHEAEVAFRFDSLHQRFKPSIERNDYRLRGIVDALSPVAGKLILDLGCGKGRFAQALQALGARVVGLDLSAAMMAEAAGLPRVRGTARRLPFGSQTFDAIIAIEVFEHLDPRSSDLVWEEARRALRHGGLLAIVDKNVAALDARRPWLPSILLKRLDEYRGRWMYPTRGPVRERWFWPPELKAQLKRRFDDVKVVGLLAPAEEKTRLFHWVPAARLMILWSARVPGDDHA